MKYAALLALATAMPVSKSIAQPINVMTYNIRLNVKSDGQNAWDNRKAVLAAQVNFYEPDFLGIQEALPEQVNYLDSTLAQYHHIGIAREGKGKGEASSIFYNFKRFELLRQNTIWLSATPDSISKGWDAAYLRVCTYGLFLDKKTKRKCWVFNTHLDNTGEVARIKSTELILRTINNLNASKLPVILTGDFNSTPESSVISMVKSELKDTRDISLMKPFGPAGTFNNFQFDKPVTMLIDYVFVSKTPLVTVEKYAVLSDSYNLKYPSDHLPVFVQLSF